MAEDKDTGFKITDRRKFNVDGTPREGDGEPAASGVTETQQPPPQAEAQAQASEATADNAAANNTAANNAAANNAAADNVVSFEAAKKKEPPRPEPAPQASTKAAEPNAAASEQKQAAAAAEQAYTQAAGPKSTEMPEASFLGLVNMLAVEAAMHLGMIRTPEGIPPVDLESARHLIDLLGVLQQKSRGNLTNEEDNLLDNVLADLRMQFVALTRRK